MNSSVCPRGKEKKMHSCYIAPFLIRVNPDNLKINDLLCSCLDESKVTFWKNAVTTCTCIQTLPRGVITFSLFMPEIPEETTMGDTSCPWRYYCKYHTNAVSCIMADTTVSSFEAHRIPRFIVRR